MLSLMDDMASRGILYIASGHAFVEEANRSASSVKRQHPKMPITLFTDEKVAHPVFDQVVAEPPLGQALMPKEKKIACLMQSPYRQTLFLDTDTYVCGNLSELFPLLQSFDMAAAHAPNRLHHKHGPYPSDLPESFPEMNTGVLLYRSNSPNVQDFLERWLDRYQAMRRGSGVERDQLSFREVIFRSDLRIATLTPEYNCRFNFPMYLDKPAKILHGRHSTLDEGEIERIVNRDGGVYKDGVHRRVFHVQTGRLHRPWEPKPSIPERLHQTIEHIVLILKDIIRKDKRTLE